MLEVTFMTNQASKNQGNKHMNLIFLQKFKYKLDEIVK